MWTDSFLLDFLDNVSAVQSIKPCPYSKKSIPKKLAYMAVTILKILGKAH